MRAPVGVVTPVPKRAGVGRGAGSGEEGGGSKVECGGGGEGPATSSHEAAVGWRQHCGGGGRVSQAAR